MATAEHIKAVAGRVERARESGSRLVAVVSAMGKTTDRLLRLAGEVSRDPSPREIDQLLATGEEQSVAYLQDGTVHVWGGNGSGQLGLGDYTSRLTPVQLTGL